MTGQGIALAASSEQDLRSRLATSEPAAFDELVALHAPRIRRLAHRLLGWRETDAEDVVQDVFLAALKRLPRFRGDSSIATWLTTITINRCRTHRRRRLLRLRWLTRRAPGDSESSPADRDSLDREVSSRVRSAVRALSAVHREVIVLFYLEALTAEQIAALLDISRGAVELRLHRARARLKESLSDLMSD